MRDIAACVIGLALIFTADLHAQTPPRNFLVIVDDLHFEFRITARARDLIRRTLWTLIRNGDLIGVVSTGPSSIAVPPTADHSVLEDVIKRVSGGGLSRRDLLDTPTIAGATELLRREETAFSVATDAVRALTSTEKSPPTILYFTSGYPSLVTEPVELITAVLAANAALYVIDPRLLVSGPSSQAHWDPDLSATQTSLRTLAQRTGGTAVFAVSEWNAALALLK